ncbi:MAG: hypothetical protein LBT14_09950 [Treponema sp.]|jgi:hypothetical protein|nr:hypothetical protein [Treponema sp.]
MLNIMDGVIEALKEIDSKITDIRMGAAGVIYTDIGLDKLLPINIWEMESVEY